MEIINLIGMGIASILITYFTFIILVIVDFWIEQFKNK